MKDPTITESMMNTTNRLGMPSTLSKGNKSIYSFGVKSDNKSFDNLLAGVELSN